jgi:hypothetical protein
MSSPAQPPVLNDPRLQQVGTRFPRLRQYLPMVRVKEGQRPAGTDRQLEFYAPWESRNPNKGQITLELYEKMQPERAITAMGGDLLHYIGSVDPSTGKPIDPKYYALKQEVMNARTPHQIQTDWNLWANDVKGGDRRSFKDWLQQSRIDAYIRGYVTPDLWGSHPDEWRKNGWYREPRMEQAVKNIQGYLTEPDH